MNYLFYFKYQIIGFILNVLAMIIQYKIMCYLGCGERSTLHSLDQDKIEMFLVNALTFIFIGPFIFMYMLGQSRK